MKRKDITTLLVIAIMSTVFSILLSKTLFKAAHQKVSVPVVQPLSSDFPQIKNDPNYNTIFYEGALDPTQLILIGETQNNKPFGQ